MGPQLLWPEPFTTSLQTLRLQLWGSLGVLGTGAGASIICPEETPALQIFLQPLFSCSHTPQPSGTGATTMLGRALVPWISVDLNVYV